MLLREKDLITDQKGIALVLALIMLLALTLIGFAAVSLSGYDLKIAGNERVYNNAFYAADGGIENFRGRASSGEFIYTVGTSGQYQVTIGNATANVTYRRTSRSEGGIDYAVFLVRSEGVAPSIPTAGRVVVESIIETAMMMPEGYN